MKKKTDRKEETTAMLMKWTGMMEEAVAIDKVGKKASKTVMGQG